jgi:hypothetical protein
VQNCRCKKELKSTHVSVLHKSACPALFTNILLKPAVRTTTTEYQSIQGDYGMFLSWV